MVLEEGRATYQVLIPIWANASESQPVKSSVAKQTPLGGTEETLVSGEISVDMAVKIDCVVAEQSSWRRGGEVAKEEQDKEDKASGHDEEVVEEAESQDEDLQR